jgi:hypothetical protein
MRYNKTTMKKLLLSLFLSIFILGISACGYDGEYRYPCMDPDNWKNKECNPPECIVEGSCTKDLIGFDWETNPENKQLEDFIHEEEEYEQEEE